MKISIPFALAACLLTLGASIALAAEPPRYINFTQQIQSIDGKPAIECKEMGEKDGKPHCERTGAITLGEMAAAGLMLPDQNASLEDQVKRGRLAPKVVDGSHVDLTADDVALIKARIGKLGLSPLYVAQAVELLDPAAVKGQP